MAGTPPRPDGMGDRIFSAGPNNASSVEFDTGNQIQYWGGSVILGGSRVYVIWYGTFDSGTVGILSTLLGSIGGSPYFNINTGYFDSSGNSISNSVSFMGSVQNNYTRGKALHTSDIGGIVSDTLSGGLLPLDTNGLYMVLTAGDVSVTGFGTQFCGYHTAQTMGSNNIHYAFIGNPDPAHLNNCAVQQTNSPNNNPGADAMASTMTHELEEFTTDPNLDAWYDSGGNEVADKCAWNFGTTYSAPNGSLANMNLGGNNYLIQQDWVNASGGYCGLSASPGPDFAVWASTSSEPVAAGSSTGSYVASIIPVKGFSGAVSFSLSGLPPGATASATPPSPTGSELSGDHHAYRPLRHLHLRHDRDQRRHQPSGYFYAGGDRVNAFECDADRRTCRPRTQPRGATLHGEFFRDRGGRNAYRPSDRVGWFRNL